MLIAVLVVTVTGCGGGSNRAGSTTKTASSAATTAPSTNARQSAAGSTPVVRAEAICARRNRELSAIARPGASLVEIVGSATRRAAIPRRSLSELERISPPTSIAADWKTILAATERALQATEKLAHSSGPTDLASLRNQIALIGKPQIRLLLTATKVGLRHCAVVAAPTLQVPAQAR
jgi:hypothetical protein